LGGGSPRESSRPAQPPNCDLSTRALARLTGTSVRASSFIGLISDVLGLSGRAILEALANGETDPERLVDLTRGRLKAKRAAL
jgi:hypothetical protein